MKVQYRIIKDNRFSNYDCYRIEGRTWFFPVWQHIVGTLRENQIECQNLVGELTEVKPKPTKPQTVLKTMWVTGRLTLAFIFFTLNASAADFITFENEPQTRQEVFEMRIIKDQIAKHQNFTIEGQKLYNSVLPIDGKQPAIQLVSDSEFESEVRAITAGGEMISRFQIKPLSDGSWELVEWPYGRTVKHGIYNNSDEAKRAADNLSRETINYEGAK